MNIDEYHTPIIIDNGTYSIKVGFAGEKKPEAEILNVYGFPKYRNWGLPDLDNPIVIPFLVGDKAYDYKDEVGYYKINYPMDRRIIEDFNNMEKIWNYIFDKVLKIDPRKHPFLITNATLSPRYINEKIAEIFFKDFNAPFLAVINPEPLALFAANRRIGTVIDIGCQLASIAPIYMGFPLVHAFEKFNIAHSKLKDLIKRYFRMRDDKMFFGEDSRKNRLIFENLVRNYTYVSLIPNIHKDFYKRKEANEKITIEETEVNIGEERFYGPELYFHPELIGYADAPLPEVILQAISNNDEEILEDLYQNIVLSGGGTCIKGFDERLELELKKLTDREFNIIKEPNRHLLTWLGGSKIVNDYPECVNWCSEDFFAEKGEEAIHSSHINVENLEGFKN
ncbi:MAG: actin family protein [Promethearchaeota archaeon]